MKKTILTIIACVLIVLLINSCAKSDALVDKTCTVTFIQNLTNEARDSLFVEVQAGELITNPPILKREGFIFDGWFTNAADANPDPTKNNKPPKFPAYDILTKPIYLDVILYARWIK